MKKKFVYFSRAFEPDEEFTKFCADIGCEKHLMAIRLIGFNSICASPEVEDFVFNPAVVEYVENHVNFRGSMKGKADWHFRIGFAGTATVLEAETDADWHIHLNNIDEPSVKYVLSMRTKNGCKCQSSFDTPEEFFKAKEEYMKGHQT